MLGHGTRGREQVLQFLDGRPLSELPFLKRMAARFAFAMVTERWVEALHALKQHYLAAAKHGSIVHVAFTGILPVLESWMRTNPEMITSLVQHMKVVTNPRKCLKQLGFIGMPAVQEILQQGGKTLLSRKAREKSIAILYHTDRVTLFQDLPRIDRNGDEGIPTPK